MLTVEICERSDFQGNAFSFACFGLSCCLFDFARGRGLIAFSPVSFYNPIDDVNVMLAVIAVFVVLVGAAVAVAKRNHFEILAGVV